jgi:H+-translocating NAD(P) transhydrogenase subunit alpha
VRAVDVAVPAEVHPGERRVALVPETVGRLVAAGLGVRVQAGAGSGAFAPDADYVAAGATVEADDPSPSADVVLHVRPLGAHRAAALRRGCVTIGFCAPSADLDGVRALAAAGVTAFAMELVPRTSRAQSMDALTSQAMVAGYRCVLEAAVRLPRLFPLSMTAAGTVPPAKVLVLGAGVAGLQAIATARRLGAVVSAYDVRAASAEEVRSLGATFVDLGLEAVEGAGGYAREVGAERAERQRQLLAPHVAAADVVITTAAVPGRPAPLLVQGATVAAMRAGSVVVDLAAEQGGNVEGAVPGLDAVVGGARLVGLQDAPSAAPVDASRLYARNVSALLLLMTADGAVAPDLSDDVVAGTCLVHDGTVRHEPTRELLRART